jgi:hypothetical protein
LKAENDRLMRRETEWQDRFIKLSASYDALLRREAYLRRALEEIAGQTLHHTNNRYEILLAKEALSNEVSA